MAIQAIQNFLGTNNIPAFPDAGGIGVVGGTPYMRTSAGLFALGNSVIGRTWFVDTVNGSNSNVGQGPDAAFLTMQNALDNVDSYDRIIFYGDVREQCVGPLGVYNVSIFGAPGIRPHHDNAARWRAPAVPTAATALLRLREQGWVLGNFLMTGHTDYAAVELKRREDATDPDPSHAQFLGMRFDGGLYGIINNGGAGFYLIDGCFFRGQTGANGGAHVVTSTTVAVPLDVVIRKSRFYDNQSHVKGPFAFAQINRNSFSKCASNAVTVLDTTDAGAQGHDNHVTENDFNITAAEFDPSGTTGIVRGSSTDVWSGNFLTDAIESVSPPA